MNPCLDGLSGSVVVFRKGVVLNSLEVLGANDLQVVAFDGHDLVVQITCKTGRDALGRPHIEVAAQESESVAVEVTRALLAERFAQKGWTRREGRIACPACAKKAALISASS